MAEYKGIKAVLRQFYVLIKQKLDGIKVDADHFEGTLPIGKGGTGGTTGQAAFDNIADGVRTSTNPADAETMLLHSTSWYKTTVASFWEYIKGKIDSVLGLTKDNYSGTAAIANNVRQRQFSSGASTSYTISTFLEKLVSLGAISKNTMCFKSFNLSWAYADNGTLSTDYGTITLAGTNIVFSGMYSVDPTTAGENGNYFDIFFFCNPQSNAANVAGILKYTCRSGSGYGPKWSLLNDSRRTIIPTSAPANPQNGDIWIE